MRLLLTSNDLNNEKIKQFFVSQFDRLDGKTAALITAKRPDESGENIEIAKKGIENLGFKVQEININKDDIYSSYPDFDVYFVWGGNTFYILDRMRATGMDRILCDAVNKGKFYVGVNAGSMLAGPDVDSARAYGDINDLGIHNLGGFHLVPFLIFPHYIEERKKDVIEFKKFRFQEPVIALTDNQALFVTDDENILVGERGGLQFCEGCKLKDLTD